MKKTKKLWKQQFRNQQNPTPIPPPPPAVQSESVPPAPPDPQSSVNIQQILETAMLNLLREIKSRDLHQLQLHTLIHLTNNIARAMISNNQVQNLNSSSLPSNSPPPKPTSSSTQPGDLRDYPSEWCDVQEIPGVDPDEGREEFLLNDPGVTQAVSDLAVIYGGIKRDEVDAWLESPEGRNERLHSIVALDTWDKKRGIKGPSRFKKLCDEIYGKDEQKAQPQ